MKNNSEKETLFRQKTIKYLEYFGLGRWSIQFKPWSAYDGEYPDAYAAVKIDSQARAATFFVNDSFLESASESQITRTAMHEAAHVLLQRLQVYAMDRTGTVEDIEEEVEAIIKALEYSLFGIVDD